MSPALTLPPEPTPRSCVASAMRERWSASALTPDSCGCWSVPRHW